MEKLIRRLEAPSKSYSRLSDWTALVFHFIAFLVLIMSTGRAYAQEKKCEPSMAREKAIQILKESSFGRNITEIKFGWVKSVKPSGEISYHLPVSVELETPKNARSVTLVGGYIFDAQCNLVDSSIGSLDTTVSISSGAR